MKKFLLASTTVLILTSFFLNRAKGQIDTLDYKMDASYQGSFVNGKKVDKKTYEKAKKGTDSLDKIRMKSTFANPVWVKRYNPNGTLRLEALECGECAAQIGDVPIGLFITYDANGKMKSKTTYALITDKKEIKSKKKAHIINWCSILNGDSSYYDEKGQIITIKYFEMGKHKKTENYKDGKLVDTNSE